MNNVEGYVNATPGVASYVMKSILDEFGDDLSKMNGKCIDIGCGPGNLSRSLILPKLGPGSTLVGVDINKNMIDYARTSNADEKRMTFKEMNIETTNLPLEDIENYDNGLSFFCLNWVIDTRLCYENIYKLLRPGGTIITISVAHTSVWSAYLKMAEDTRYKQYTKDAKKFMTPLYFEENPRASLKKICQEIGFEVLQCSTREVLYEFKNLEEMKDLLIGINPFSHRVPKIMQNQFINDLVQATLKEGNIYQKLGKKFSEDESFFDLFKFLLVHLKKPVL